MAAIKKPSAAAAKPGAKAPAKPAAKAPLKKKASKYAGNKIATPRDPMPMPGAYRFEVLKCEETVNPGTGNESFKAHLKVLALDNEDHKEGDTVVAIFSTKAKAGLSRIKSLVMFASGYEDESEFDAFDPDGEFIEACAEYANSYSEAGLTIVGRIVDCEVRKGKATPEGDDFYREYDWAVVPEDEQEVPKPELEAE